MQTSWSFALALALVWALSSCDPDPEPPSKTWTGPVDGERVFAHAKAMVALGPRPAGSDALRKNEEYIRAQLGELGLELQVHEFVDEHFAPGITFRNLWCEIPGTGDTQRPLLVGAHYDTKKTSGHAKPEQNFRFVGAMDGAGGSALLLELARVLKDRENRPPIWLVWFDGEESIPFDWFIGKALFGSRYFCKKLLEEKRMPGAMVLFDLIGAKDWKVDRDARSNKKLLELFGEAAGRMGQSGRMYEFAQRDLQDDHMPFANAGVPTIALIDFRWRAPTDRRRHGDERVPADGEFVRWWHTPEDDVHHMSALSLDFFGNLFVAALPEIEAQLFE